MLLRTACRTQRAQKSDFESGWYILPLPHVPFVSSRCTHEGYRSCFLQARASRLILTVSRMCVVRLNGWKNRFRERLAYFHFFITVWDSLKCSHSTHWLIDYLYGVNSVVKRYDNGQLAWNHAIDIRLAELTYCLIRELSNRFQNPPAIRLCRFYTYMRNKPNENYSKFCRIFLACIISRANTENTFTY